MAVREYRRPDGIGAGPRISGDVEIGHVVRLTLPEPPSFNHMIELAKKRTRRSRAGGWMKRSLPVVYDQALERYELEAQAAIQQSGVRPPEQPWEAWALVRAHFRLHSERDLVELLASLKWPVDVLVRGKWVVDDSPRQLLSVCTPTQEIARARRGVDLYVERRA